MRGHEVGDLKQGRTGELCSGLPDGVFTRRSHGAARSKATIDVSIVLNSLLVGVAQHFQRKVVEELLFDVGYGKSPYMNAGSHIPGRGVRSWSSIAG